MKPVGVAAIVVIMASLVGCYSDTLPEPSPPPDPSASATVRPTAEPMPSPTFLAGPALVAPVSDPGELLFYCHTIAFPVRALAGVGTDELAGHPAAAALRDFLASEFGTGSFFPAHGWHFLGESLEVAEFGQLVADPIEPSGSALYVVFSRNGRAYDLNGWGDCLPRRAAPPGLLALAWWLPALVPPAPEAQTVTANVVALGCAGGPDLDLIEPPNLDPGEGGIAIALTARFVDGATGCQKGGCGVIEPTLLDIALPGPIGADTLTDLSTFPPRDATIEPWGLDAAGCGG